MPATVLYVEPTSNNYHNGTKGTGNGIAIEEKKREREPSEWYY